MLDKLIDNTQKIMQLSNEEARKLNHEYVGTEHLLLGIVDQGDNMGVFALKGLGINPEKVRLEVEKLVRPGPDEVAPGKLPQTPRLKKVIKHSKEQARSLGHNYLGAEHLLLGLLQEPECVATQALINLDLRPAKVRREVLNLLGISVEQDDTTDKDLDEMSSLGEFQNTHVGEYVDQLLQKAIEQRASDIHLSPTENGRGRVRLRIDGVLCDSDLPPEGLYGEIIRHIKTMAAMDTKETRIPQSGRVKFEAKGKKCDCRISLVPTIHGERITMRLLNLSRQDMILGLDEIGLLEDNLGRVRKLCQLPNGLIFCNGPTGCGKTTTLYSMLLELDRQKSLVMSVEDPAELSLEGVDQVQVEPQKGLTFSTALRNILRQDPDVIMVGEIRDLETAQACVTMSLTGHLVMTTLHANSSPEAIKRLVELGVKPWLISGSLSGIISQRLVRKLCIHCKEQVDPPLHSMDPNAAEFIGKLNEKTFYVAKGCPKCHSSGYHGRTAIYEILLMDDNIRALVTDPIDITALRNAACQAGMKTLLANGLEKAAQGITSIQEILRVVPPELAI